MSEDKQPVHLIDDLGRDCGEIIEASWQDSYDNVVLFHVWVVKGTGDDES
jgi:hypothetical protein